MKGSRKREGGSRQKVKWQVAKDAQVVAALSRPPDGAPDDPTRFLVGLAAIARGREPSPYRTVARNLCLAVRTMVDSLMVAQQDEALARRDANTRWDLRRTEIVVYHPRDGEDPKTSQRDVVVWMGPDVRIRDRASRARLRAAARAAADEILGAPSPEQTTVVGFRRRTGAQPPMLRHGLGTGRAAARLWRAIVADATVLWPERFQAKPGRAPAGAR